MLYSLTIAYSHDCRILLESIATAIRNDGKVSNQVSGVRM